VQLVQPVHMALFQVPMEMRGAASTCMAACAGTVLRTHVDLATGYYRCYYYASSNSINYSVKDLILTAAACLSLSCVCRCLYQASLCACVRVCVRLQGVFANVTLPTDGVGGAWRASAWRASALLDSSYNNTWLFLPICFLSMRALSRMYEYSVQKDSTTGSPFAK
jgi:hypothetical protein